MFKAAIATLGTDHKLRLSLKKENSALTSFTRMVAYAIVFASLCLLALHQLP